MPLPKLTTKQQALLILIYKHRFIARKQLQAFMGHTDKRRISAWLKDLRAKHYIEWFYSPDDPNNSSKPAVYYLGLNGIRLLRECGYPPEVLRKRYKESLRQQLFIERCLLLADCCIVMEAKNAESSGTTYAYATDTDYADPDNTYYFLNESEFIHPNLCYVKEKDTGDDIIVTTSLLEVFDTSLPQYSVRNRLKDYIEFLDSGEWEEAGRADGLPIILIVCPTKDGLIYAKRYTRKLLADTYGESEDVPEDIRIRFTTTEQLRQFGITGRVWEQV